MNRFFFMMVAAAPLWGGCQKAETDWSVIPIVRGDQAIHALASWKSGLGSEVETEYPVTVHWELDCSVKNMPQLLGKPTDGLATIVMDSTLLGGNHYRTRFVIEIVAPGFDTFLTVWLESDDNGLRLRHRGLDSIGAFGLPFSLPSGVRLSADRQVVVVDFLKRFASQIAGMAEIDDQAIQSMQGISELFHPNNMLRFLGPGALQSQTGWREAKNEVQVTVVPLKALVESAAFAELSGNAIFASLEQLKDVESVVEFDRASGAFRGLDSSLQYHFEGLPTRDDTQPSLYVDLHMELRNTQVGALVFKGRNEILDLDESFDRYWPSFVAMEPLLLQSLKQLQEDVAAEEDFPF